MLRMILVLCGLCSFSVYANQIEDFAKSQEFRQVKLSPDGKTIAVTLVNDDSASLAFFDTQTLKPINKIGFNDKKEPGQFFWVNNERIVFKLMHKRAWRDQPAYYGQLYAINKDGDRPKMIYGYNAGELNTGPSAKKRKVSTRGWAEIIDLLKDDKKHILVQSTPFSGDGEVKPKAILLNVYTGIIKNTVTYSPVPGGRFFSDSKGKIRIAVGANADDEKLVYSYEPEKDVWKEFGSGNYGGNFTPLAVSNNDKYFYVLDDFQQDKTGLYRIDLNSGKRKLMFRDQSVDITYAMLTSDKKNILAIRFDPDYPNYALVPGKSKEHKIFRNMLATFSGQIVEITSRTDDGSLSIIRVKGDVNPGVYYLYNSQSNKLTTLFKRLPHINSKRLAPMQAISFSTDDGTVIHGYLTRKNQTAKSLPLVVLPHGGPYYVRDKWDFNKEVQALASRGYAVLQVNFRGSEGYGRDFYEQGLKQWGGRIQQDIIQSVQWAIKEKIADADRICIMGGSFGAYSAVMAATIEPDLFQCAVANVGVYNLELMYEEGDIKDAYWGEAYLERAIGRDPKTLKEYSPVNHVSQLKAKLFIAHGEKDDRAPIEHAEQLKDALDKHKIKYEWFVKETEGHGYYSDKNRAEYLSKVIAFIEKSIGAD